MFSEARKQSMAWMETDYSKHFRWKIKWRLEHLGALGTMGETAPLIEYRSVTSEVCKLSQSNLQTYHEIQTAAARTCANFQIASTTESEDREV